MYTLEAEEKIIEMGLVDETSKRKSCAKKKQRRAASGSSLNPGVVGSAGRSRRAGGRQLSDRSRAHKQQVDAEWKDRRDVRVRV
ncbi:hypothetical protein ColLi_03572 [Colletotrichum liriopes]|uniref:Uncharacterized protein n=1 Tax=Colletotrichum liriopes TaxID=708192 RepID=A0AA37GHC7_9PEZI|nr:hypothetical protein ColLi_03572 [Colletotrichum liriopes]